MKFLETIVSGAINDFFNLENVNKRDPILQFIPVPQQWLLCAGDSYDLANDGWMWRMQLANDGWMWRMQATRTLRLHMIACHKSGALGVLDFEGNYWPLIRGEPVWKGKYE